MLEYWSDGMMGFERMASGSESLRLGEDNGLLMFLS